MDLLIYNISYTMLYIRKYTPPCVAQNCKKIGRRCCIMCAVTRMFMSVLNQIYVKYRLLVIIIDRMAYLTLLYQGNTNKNGVPLTTVNSRSHLFVDIIRL